MIKAYPSLSAALLAGGFTLGILSPTSLRADQEAKIKGTVSQIDPTRNRIELRTEKGQEHLYVTPETIKDLKVGDKVEVQLELKKGSPNAGAVYEEDTEEHFPHSTAPEEDMAKKSKEVGS